MPIPMQSPTSRNDPEGFRMRGAGDGRDCKLTELTSCNTAPGPGGGPEL